MLPQDFTTDVVKTAIQLVVENAFKYGLPAAKRKWEQVKKENVGKTPAFALKGDLVNRESVMRAFNAALDERDTTRVIYLCGPGGAGKTRLLEEVSRKITNSTKSPRWAGIFDLYHTDLHNILRLQSAIIESLDTDKRYFAKYRDAKEQFSQKRRDGIFSLTPDASVYTEVATLNQFFVNELNQFASRYRAVLAFDTLENIGDELDLIQQIFGFEADKGTLSTKQWLLDLSRTVENTVILLAGRPNPDLRLHLEQINQANEGRVEVIEIGGLTRSDAAHLLNAYTRKAPRPIASLLTQNADRVWQITKGLPVQLALMVELVLQTPQILETQSAPDVFETGRKIVRTFFDGENPDKRSLFFLALARKGLTPDLLHFLEPKWSKEKCAQRLAKTEQLALVKKRHGDNELFLHDALYELFDSYSSFSEREIADWFQRLFEYYQERQREESGDRSRWEKSTINLLYYDLRRDSLRAFYQTFVRWSEIAIKGYEMELETQLRNEVLICLHNDSQHKQVAESGFTEAIFNQDNVVRWIERLIMKTQCERAAEVAETFLTFGPDEFLMGSRLPLIGLSERNETILRSIISTAPPIFWASLLTYYGESLTYLINRPEEQINTVLRKSVELLEGLMLDKDHPLWWFRNRLLGRAYDRLGYLARVKGHYKSAVDYYHKALPFFKDTEIDDEYAFTLNNLAFVLALLGDAQQGRVRAEEALGKRQKLGQRYPLALSYNTLGLIRALEDPGGHSGQQDCEYALSVFEELNTPRGIGLACNALGFILRKRGDGWKTSRCTPSQAVQWYEESEKFLERAEKIFQDGEKIRLWEAYNELGSLYNGWGRLLRSSNDQSDPVRRFEKSVEYQSRALKLAQENNMGFQEVDACDDLAQVYLDWGNFNEAQKWIEQGKSLIPSEFNLEKSISAGHHNSSGEIYWLSLGKLQLREGVLEIRKAGNIGIDEDTTFSGVCRLLSSFLYFQLYSTHPRFLERKGREIAFTIRELAISRKVVDDAIQQLEREYNLHLSVLLSALSQG